TKAREDRLERRHDRSAILERDGWREPVANAAMKVSDQRPHSRVASQPARGLSEHAVDDAERRLGGGRRGHTELCDPTTAVPRHMREDGALPGEIDADRALFTAQHDAELPRCRRERDAETGEAARTGERHAQIRSPCGSLAL